MFGNASSTFTLSVMGYCNIMSITDQVIIGGNGIFKYTVYTKILCCKSFMLMHSYNELPYFKELWVTYDLDSQYINFQI